jgi:hypothetical protein
VISLNSKHRIWEKKYGRNANHKKKEALEMMERGQKRLLQVNSRRERAHRNDPLTDRVKPQPRKLRYSGLAVGAADHTSSQDNKPLHPSWEAKRKMKGKQSGAIASVQPIRKIVFS